MKLLKASVLIAATSTLLAPTLAAQERTAAESTTDTSGSVEYLAALERCQIISDNDDRLTCYDTAVGRVVAAAADGDVTLVDREDVKTTRRNLFGLKIPDLGIFGNADDETEDDELFQSTVTGVSFRERKAITFTIADGDAVWRIGDPPARLRRLKAGDTVVFKEAALGTYFIRVNGSTGVKGRRIR